MKPTLIILAAGMGSRYGGLKQMDPLGPGGESIIDYSVYDALRAGFGKIVFVIRKSIEKDFREVFADRFLKSIDYELVFQEMDMLPEGYTFQGERTKPWGTGHAIWVCRDAVKEPFAVINADDFYGREAFQELATFLTDSPSTTPNDYAMCGYHIGNTLSEHGGVARGVCNINAEGFLNTVEEQFNIQKDDKGNIVSERGEETVVLDPDTIVSMNMWAFNPSLFDIIETHFRAYLESDINNPKSELYIPFIVDGMIKEGKGRVKVLKSPAQWFGVTYIEDKPLVMQKLKELTDSGEYPESLWK